MAISLKHTFQSAKADGADTTLVQPSNWNAEHTITAAAGKVLGRDTSGAGVVQELPIAVDTSGNVGIGTTSPGGRLDVRSANITVGSNDALVQFRSTTAQAADVGASLQLGGMYDGSNSLGFAEVAGRKENSTSGNWSGYLQFSTRQFGGAFAERMRIDSAGNVGIGTSSPGGRLDLNGNFVSNITAVAASAIDCTSGNFFTKTASGALTWTISNAPASRAYSFLLELTNGGTGTQTWFTGIKWPGGTAPTLTASGVDMLGFITDDGGTTWRGVQLMKDSK